MTILLLDPYFKIKDWMYRGVFGDLVKISLNLISFLPISPNFGGIENLRFWGNREAWVLSYPFHSFSLKLPNKGMDLSIPSIKTPKQRNERNFPK